MSTSGFKVLSGLNPPIAWFLSQFDADSIAFMAGAGYTAVASNITLMQPYLAVPGSVIGFSYFNNIQFANQACTVKDVNSVPSNPIAWFAGSTYSTLAISYLTGNTNLWSEALSATLT